MDFKLAFTEYEKSFPPADSVVPQFNSLTRCWPPVTSPGWEIPDFARSCKTLYCHNDECIKNEYYDSQKRQLAKLEITINQWLENWNALTGKDKEDTKLKTDMQGKGLIQLLPGTVPAFALRNRTWGMYLTSLDDYADARVTILSLMINTKYVPQTLTNCITVQVSLDQLEYVEEQDGWNKLVLPKGHRELVQAMVETHARGSTSSTSAEEKKVEMDLVRGKGMLTKPKNSGLWISPSPYMC